MRPTKTKNTGGRGGAKPGAGQKKKALVEKLDTDNPGGRPLMILDIPDFQGVEMPPARDFLSSEQRDGSDL